MASHSVSVETISFAAATQMVSAGVERATEKGVPATIAICDPGGELKAFARMDGAPLVAVKVAQDKAYTAIGFGIPTHEWYEFIKDDPAMLTGAPPGVDRLIVFGGGFPIIVDGVTIGAIGVSGGLPSDDMETAQAALAALA